MRKIAYAKIEAGQIVGQEVFEEDRTPPGELWLPIEVEAADYNRITHKEVGRGNRIDGTRVVRFRIIEPIPVTANMVKAEAQRRIIALTRMQDLQACMIKQLNALMRANELNDKRISGQGLTPAEEQEATQLRALADAIKLIRAKSNAIEAMGAIPVDFRADNYWS